MNTPKTKTTTTTPPALEAAGAGLPPVEARFFRHGLPVLSRALTRDCARKIFLQEGQRILYLAQDLADWELEEPVLVKRPFGVEDSSRYWSMEMLLEHLIVSGMAMHKIMRQLSAGARPPQGPRVADGKPQGGRGPHIRDEFRRFLQKFADSCDELIFPPRPTVAHPWTSEMNACQWFKFSALHHWMHRVHAERIAAGIL